MATETLDIIRGGSFLVEDHPLDQVFIPEEFTEEEQMTGDLVRDFVDNSVVPVSGWWFSTICQRDLSRRWYMATLSSATPETKNSSDRSLTTMRSTR